MTFDIALVFVILTLAVLLFVTERLRVDVVALLVLGSLALTGLVTPAEALSGFSNPAVVTVWAVFILSSGMSRTGVANLVGRQVLRLAGSNEIRLLIVIMLTAGTLSAFMNNVGVAALLLPVVMDIARRIGRAPSKLLMPLAFGALLGGLTTLIGTPPNILISDALRENGLQPFQMFDYAPVGLAVMLVGIAFMALIGRYLLPTRDIAKALARPEDTDLGEIYELQERLFIVQLPEKSTLAGKSLVESRLGAALGLNVIAVIRDGKARLAPTPQTALQPGDKLLVQGRRDHLDELHNSRLLTVEEDSLAIESVITADTTEIGIVELGLNANSSFVGQTLEEIDLRQRFNVNVLAVRRDNVPHRTKLEEIVFQPDDTLLIQGPYASLETLVDAVDFDFFRPISDTEIAQVYRLQERLIALKVSGDSILEGKTLRESRLNDAFGLTVLGIIRDGVTNLIPDPEEVLEKDNTLLVEGKPEALLTLRGLQSLEIEPQRPPDLDMLESEHVGLAEAVLSPHSLLAGKSLRQIHFRAKYGLNVLAIWHRGRAYRSNLRDRPLQLGDALLLHGSREKLQVLASESDFLILTESAQEVPRPGKAPLALAVMGIVLVPVILGWLPISIAAVVGATLMVLTGVLTMDEAYRFIEWRAVFLIAGMLPLGIAMENTGAAHFIAQRVVTLVGGLGPSAVIASLFILAALTSQVMPNPAVAVLLAPIALNTAGDIGISPYALMMTVALSASASFLSPVAHPANLLILGPGGYYFKDYLKVGLPLTLVVLGIVLLILPLFWPYFP